MLGSLWVLASTIGGMTDDVGVEVAGLVTPVESRLLGYVSVTALVGDRQGGFGVDMRGF